MLLTQIPRWVGAQVQACSVAHCAGVAAGIRGRLPLALPPRLLAGPLLAQLPAALQGGPAPTLALLHIATAMMGPMDAKAAAAHADQLFDFLLKALDVRYRRPDSLDAAGELPCSCLGVYDYRCCGFSLALAVPCFGIAKI